MHLFRKIGLPVRRLPIRKAVLFSLAFIVLDQALLLAAPVVNRAWPVGAAALAWLWFSLPGFAAAAVLSKKIPWAERIPVSFVLAVGLNTPAALAAILLRLTLDQYILLVRGTLILLLLVYLIFQARLNRFAENPEDGSPEISAGPLKIHSIFFLLVAGAIAGYLAYLSSTWLPDGDDISGLPIFSELLRLGKITGVEPFHGSGTPSTPRNELIAWTYANILVNKVSGLAPFDFFMFNRPVLIVLAFLAAYTLIHQTFKSQSQSLFLLSLWSIYLAATIQEEGAGSNLITRIIQDKFLGWFVIVPVLLVFLIWFLRSQSGRWRYLFYFGFGALGATFVHPITFTQLAILSTGFVPLYLLFEHRRQSKKGILGLGVILLVCLSFLAIQYFRYQGRMPIEEVGLGEAVEFGRFRMAVNRYRLWLLEGGGYVLHPSLILQPIVLAGYLALPVHILNLRKSSASRLILASLLVMPLILYIPFTAKLVGLIVTPFLLWRVAWPLELFSVLSAGSAAWLVVGYLLTAIDKRTDRAVRFQPAVFSAAVVIALAAFRPSFDAGMRSFQERLESVEFTPCYKGREILTHLDQLAYRRPVNVLASRPVNFCIPAYSALANVVEFRGYGTVNRLPLHEAPISLQRIYDVDYFSHTKRVDQRFIDILRRYEIDYILVENERFDLNLQLKLLEDLFTLVYSDADFSLYALGKSIPSSRIIAANTALSFRRWDDAEQILGEVLRENPEDVLAYIDLGEVHEARGDIEQAIQSYAKAGRLAPQEAGIHVRLAKAYTLVSDYEKVIEAYNRALADAPHLSNIQSSLGTAYILAGQLEDGKNALERSVGQKAVPGTAVYHTLLAKQFAALDLFPEAVAHYREAVRLGPDPRRYVDLGAVLVKSGEQAEAVENFKKAIRMDRWLYSPHVHLGQFYQSQGDLDAAIAEYETAIRLNPAYSSSFILVGQAVMQKSGQGVAADRLQKLLNINEVLPGPHIALASLHAANADYSSALNEYDSTSRIMPSNASLVASRAYLLLENGEPTKALELYDRALSLNPNLISVQAGLIKVYMEQNDFSQVSNQIIQVLQNHPNQTKPRLLLADIYARDGRWDAAEAELLRLIRLAPENGEGYSSLANLYTRRGLWEEAAAAVQRALETDPENSSYLLQMGEIYQNQAEYATALQYFEKAVEVDPEDADARQRLADYYWSRGEFEKSMAMRQELAAELPDSAPALLSLADAYRKQGEITRAGDTYKKAIDVDPSLIFAYLALTHLEAEEDISQDAAVPLLQAAFNANPDSSLAFIEAGKFFQQQGQFDAAERVLKAGLAVQDVKPMNYSALSDLQAQIGDWEAAVQTLKDAVRAFPDDPGVYTELGALYLSRGSGETAEAAFKAALDVDARYAPASIALANLESQRGKIHQAQEILEKAAAANPGSFEVFAALGRFHEKMGDLEMAETHLKKAVFAAPAEVKAYLELGQFYQRQRRGAEAMDVFRQALKVPAPSVDLHLAIGGLYQELGQGENALDWYRKAAAIDQSSAAPYLALAGYYLEQRDWEAGVEALNTGLSVQPASFAVHLALGELYQRNNLYKEAQRHLLMARSLDWRRVEPQVDLGNLYTQAGFGPQAVSILNQAVQTNPAYLPAYSSLAGAYRSMDRPSEAEQALNAAVQQGLDRQAARLERARFYAERRDWDRALEDYQAAWDMNPLEQTAGLQLAAFLTGRGEYGQAQEVLDRLASLPTADHRVQVEFGRLHALQGRWDSSGEAYRQALHSAPGSLDASAGLAQAYEMQGKSEQALEVLMEAVAAAPRDPQAFANLGNAYLARLKDQEALIAFQKAFELGSNSAEVAVNLYELGKRTGEGGDPLELLLERVNQTPTQELAITLGELYQARGDWKAARYWFRQAADRFPNNPAGWYALGSFFTHLEEWDQALQAFTKARQYGPGSSSLLLALGAVQQEKGMEAEALESCRLAVDVEPTRIENYIALSGLENQTGRPEQALETIQTGIEMAPGSYRGYHTLGQLLAAGGENERAREAYLDGLERVPGAAALRAGLGDLHTNRVLEAETSLDAVESVFLTEQYRVDRTEDIRQASESRRKKRVLEYKLRQMMKSYYTAQGNLKAAQANLREAELDFGAAWLFYTEALESQPNNEAALIGLGRLSLLKGSEDQALQYYQRSAGAHPDSILSLSYLGDSYFETGRFEEAAQIFQEILTRDPTNQFAHLFLARAYQEMDDFGIMTASSTAAHGQYGWKHMMDYIRWGAE